MRRIDVPKEAVDRHEKTLGAAILSFLDRLAKGERVSWAIKSSGNKTKEQLCLEREKTIQEAVGARCRPYWIWLQKEFRDNHILTARPARLIAFSIRNKQKVAKFLVAKESRNAVREICGRLFDYSAFRSGKILLTADGAGRILWVEKHAEDDEKRRQEWDRWKGWNIAEFVQRLDIRYCPYCNAENVGTAHLPSSEFVPDIDHIFPKGAYPLLSLSLYNLVPACNRCNSRFKNEHDMLSGWNGVGDLPALHPYVHHIYKHLKFDYNPISVGNLYLRPHSVDPTYVSPLTVSAAKESVTRRRRTENYISRYHLRAIYSDQYSEEINEAIRIESLCSPRFVESMKELYGVVEDDFDRLFHRTSLDPREINHYRFAKLIGDLHDSICFDVSDEKKACIIERLKKRFGLV